MFPAAIPGLDPRYTIERELGSGSFGVVFLAHDAATDRNVVLKVARETGELGQPITDERASGVLLHPNIVQMIGSGDAGGKAYLVLEFVDGVALKALLKNGPMPWGDAVTIGIAVAHALEYAHSKGIIHRDVKPSNVLIPVLHGIPLYAQAKLSDFGVLGLLGANAQTRAGTVVGTPYFMAPEQLMGAPNSAATDVYGLGALLYRMVYGARPFPAANLAELMQKVLHEAPEFPAISGVPEALRELIRRSMEKDPAARPSMLELSRALPALLPDDEPAALLPPEPAAGPPRPPVEELLGTTVAGPAPALGSPEGIGRPWPLFVSGLAGASIAAIALGLAGNPAVWKLAPMFGLAILLSMGGFVAAAWVRRLAAGRRVTLNADARSLLFGQSAARSLSDTISAQIEQLRAQCRRVDESVLVSTVSYMYNEFRNATDSRDRQAALMNFVELVDKLAQRLAPWYVRYEKAFTAVATLVGVSSGLFTLGTAVAKLVSGKP